MRTLRSTHPHRRSFAAIAFALALTFVVIGPVPGASGTGTTGGTRLWLARYNNPRNGYDQATAVAASPDGTRVYVTGYGSARTSRPYHYETVAYDAATGVRIWARRYDGPGIYYDFTTALAVSPNGAVVFVTGVSSGPANDNDYATLAYDAATGTRLWLRRFNGPGSGNDSANALAVSPDGATVYVTGEVSTLTSYYDYATVAYGATTGAQIWVRLYDGPADNYRDAASAVSVSPDGATVFVTGESATPATFYDYATVAYRATTGAQIWVRRYDGPANYLDRAEALAVSPDGASVYVTGESSSGLGSEEQPDYATVAYDATTGTQIWVRRYDGPAHYYDDAHDIAVSPDGARVYVTGGSAGFGTNAEDFATLAYDAITGATVWVRRYNGPMGQYDQANALAVSPDGARVYVTGFSLGVNEDYATLAYDAITGSQVWMRPYAGPGKGADRGEAIAVSPDSARVYVTGASFKPGTLENIVTIAYRAG